MALALAMNSYASDTNRVVGAGQGARTDERRSGRRGHQEMPSFHGRCSLVSFVAGLGRFCQGLVDLDKAPQAVQTGIFRVQEDYALLCFYAVVLIVPLCAQVKFTPQADRIQVEIDGKPYSTFYLAPGGNKPYVYPLSTASGIVVTRHFPMETFPG